MVVPSIPNARYALTGMQGDCDRSTSGLSRNYLPLFALFISCGKHSVTVRGKIHGPAYRSVVRPASLSLKILSVVSTRALLQPGAGNSRHLFSGAHSWETVKVALAAKRWSELVAQI